jgi:hypothetical protein
LKAVQRLLEKRDAELLEVARLPDRRVDAVAAVGIDLHHAVAAARRVRRSRSRSPGSPCMPILASNIV